MYLAVCDDQAEDLGSIDALLCTWEKKRNVSLRRKLFSNAVELLDAARQEKFTLYLLDVIMPGINGMSAARELRGFDRAADIVFLTSSPEFAWESYRVQALDYLVKPVDKELLFGLLDKLYRRELRPQEALVLKTGSAVLRIPFSELSFVEVIGRRLYFNMTSGDMQEVVGAMRNYEAQLLSRPEFMRIHRSYMSGNLSHYLSRCKSMYPTEKTHRTYKMGLLPARTNTSIFERACAEWQFYVDAGPFVRGLENLSRISRMIS